ncbi:MAG TPA: T9SS type A sorting domain-containing protein, partial [Bacteroidia bacterium]|nr:T9SS type A sorting domain-containing protein [Bacteroidia bacterium]
YSNVLNAQVPVPPAHEIVLNDHPYGDNFCWPPSPRDERMVDIAMDSAGNYVATWSVFGDPTPSENGVYYKRFNKNGVALSGDIQAINCNVFGGTLGAQDDRRAGKISAIAMNPTGNFVIAYLDDQMSGWKGFYVKAKLFNATGVQIGSEIVVESDLANQNLNDAKVAMDAAGNFVVAWENRGNSTFAPIPPSPPLSDICFRRYDAAGNPLGPVQRIPGNELGRKNYERALPEIGMNSLGDFIITWQQRMGVWDYHPNTAAWDVWAQRYNAAGISIAPTFSLITQIGSYAMQPNADIADNGNFVITWEYPSRYQLYNASGELIKYSGIGTSDWTDIDVSMNADGDFILTSTAPNDANQTHISRFNADGSLITDIGLFPYVWEYYDGGTCSPYTGSYNGQSAIALNDKGDFVVAFNAIDQDDGWGGYFNSEVGFELLHMRWSVNTPPHITPGAFCVSNTLTVGGTVGTVQVTTERTQTVSNFSITSGNTGNVFSINPSTGVITVINPPNWGSNPSYTLGITVQDNGNALNPPATGSRQVIINTIIPPAPTSVTNGTVCVQGNVLLSATTATGTPQWFAASTGGTDLATDTSYYTPYINSTTTYYVASNYNGCQSTTRLPVIAYVNPPLNVVANTSCGVHTACKNQWVGFYGTGATSYTWFDEGTSSNPLTINDGTYMQVSGGNHLLIVVGTKGQCVGFDTIPFIVSNTAPPNVIANATSNSVCIGNSTTLSGSGADTYTWTGGISNGVAFSPTVTASYSLWGTRTSDNCQGTANKTITVNPLPGVTASATSDTIVAGNPDTLRGGGANTYTWTNGVSNGVAFTPTATATYTVTGTDANGCVNIAAKQIVVVPNPMPIELIQFDAVRQQEKAKLTWTTATETNNNYFTVMRSTDAINWESIGKVKGAGNSTQTLHYNFTDDKAAATINENGILYYRIKQTDFNGASEIFPARSLNWQDANNASSLQAYPNPVNDELNIIFRSDETVSAIEIRNSLGQIVYASDNLSPDINTKDFAEGMYLLVVKTTGKIYQRKFVKVASAQ